MMKNFDFKPFLPHLFAIVGFLVLSFIYFYPAMEGRVLKQHDIVMAKSMQQEIIKYQKQSGETILWSNAIFSGMPTYQIWMRYPNNVSTYIMKYIRLKFLPSPIGSFFIYFIGFYILLLVLKIRPLIAFIGGVAFAFSSYNLINIEAGHLTKGLAMGFAPLVLSGIILALQGRLLGGMALTALALSLEIRANHLQITYYLFITILILLIVEFIHYLKEKQLIAFIKTMAALLIAVILAVAVNITALWTTNEYARYTMRGGSELQKENTNTKGLDKDYALSWSYGARESFTLLIPNFAGGATTQTLGPNSKLAKLGVAPKNLKNVPTYWGQLRSTSGPIYIGAIVIFLFILGMFLVKNRLKWWLFASALLALFLSWGSNFPFLTNLFFDYFPLYNKFRVPMTLLLIVGMVVPVLSFFFLEELLNDKYSKPDLLKALKYTLYSLGGLLLFFILLGGSIFDFQAQIDETLKSNGWPVDVLREDRARMLRLDAVRSLFFILVTAGAIYLYAVKKVKAIYLVVIVGVAVLIDMWGLDKRYFNKDDFFRKPRRASEGIVQQRPADQLILQDPDAHYRVMDVTTDPWNDASPAYYHHFIGGYHGAKLSRYQDMISETLTPEIQNFIASLRAGSGLNPGLTPSYNMLNTKYFIVAPGQNGVVKNPYALGNAWFVDSVVVAGNTNEEMSILKSIDPAKKAVVDKKFKDLYTSSGPASMQDYISLTDYHPNHIKYTYESSNDRLAVFSEIYYDKGWKAFIDNKEVPHFRVDYVLRAMMVPAGAHDIEFRFEPRSYYTGEKVSLAASILLVLLILGSVGVYFRNENQATLPENENKKPDVNR